MATMEENVIATGSENYPPMLEKGMYDSGKTRIMLYIQGKENGEMLNDSIKNGPVKLLSEITVKDRDGVTDIRRPQKVAYLSQEEKLRYDSDIRAVNIILLGLPVDIYTLINHFQTAKDIFDQSQGYEGNTGKNQASGARVVNRVGNAGTNQPRFKEFFDSKEVNALDVPNKSWQVSFNNGTRWEPEYYKRILLRSEVQAIKEIKKWLKESELQQQESLVIEGTTLEACLVTKVAVLEACLVNEGIVLNDNMGITESSG
ncbi:hypothetical protein Tco_1066357 [Tanacetum coccineum]|uniref:Uncharacterized protein n=1 Tax=Tanacetum coccineum TaxID=301880 RepID=A0ABQ5HAC8_9ASTR